MTEVLAPVGSVQALKSAIFSGADAVYLGLDLFNARIKADNFTIDNIKDYVDYCHLFGVKVYITFNTSVKDSEREKFAEYVDVTAKAGVDAFIVTDLGCLDILRKYDIPLHGSTQIGVHNLAGALVLQELGFTRVVLARETLFEDIRSIRENTHLEIEYFVHGALCVCFSGSCLMSSMMSGDSGNRGRCNQPCRLKYSSSFNSREKYLLSPKDQCFIDDIAKLIELGVDSLKIEGRLKQPHYVGEVTAQYRKAVDNVLSGRHDKIDYSALKRAYNRGNFTRGYNFETSKQIIFDKINGNIGEVVGKVVGNRKGEIIVSLTKPLNVGDGIKIIGKDKELGGLSVNNLKKVGDKYAISSNKPFEIGSDICITSDTEQIKKYQNVNPKLSIELTLNAVCGERLSIRAKYGDIEVECFGDTVEAAQNRKTDEESVIKQLSRLGDSNFTADIKVNLDERNDVFLPLSALNNLRRSVLTRLSESIIEKYNNGKQRVEYSDENACFYRHDFVRSGSRIWLEVDMENIDPIVFENIGEKFNLVVDYSSKLAQFIEIILKNDLIKNKIEDIYLKLPRVARGKDYHTIDKFISENSKIFDGILADNLYGVYLAKKYQKKLLGGIGLNIYNSSWKKVLGFDEEISSVELTKNELINDSVLYAYGLLPIMTLLHCPVQVNTGCDCKNCNYTGDFCYYDKRGQYLIKRTKLNYCQFTLFNQQKVDIIGKIPKGNFSYYLNLCGCDKSDILRITEKYVRGEGSSDANTTYGHLYRGVK